jgi:hypothetical protein
MKTAAQMDARHMMITGDEPLVTCVMRAPLYTRLEVISQTPQQDEATSEVQHPENVLYLIPPSTAAGIDAMVDHPASCVCDRFCGEQSA